ncbi:MAG: hypothetical protein R2705_14970 [Ilumatobacteraceae bacterium]
MSNLLGGVEEIEVRSVDGVLYVRLGDGPFQQLPDFGSDPATVLGEMGPGAADLPDPERLFDRLAEMTDAERVGTAVIDGVETTQYRGTATFDGSDPWLDNPAAGDQTVSGEVTADVDLYVDVDGLLRQVVVDGSASHDEVTDQQFRVVTTFDVGSDLTVAVPENVVPFELSNLFDLGD